MGFVRLISRRVDGFSSGMHVSTIPFLQMHTEVRLVLEPSLIAPSMVELFIKRLRK